MTKIEVPPGDALIPAQLAAQYVRRAQKAAWDEGYEAGYMDAPGEFDDPEDDREFTNPYDTEEA